MSPKQVRIEIGVNHLKSECLSRVSVWISTLVMYVCACVTLFDIFSYLNPSRFV